MQIREKQAGTSAKQAVGSFSKGWSRWPVTLIFTDTASSLLWLNLKRDLARVEDEKERGRILHDIQEKTKERGLRSWLCQLFALTLFLVVGFGSKYLLRGGFNWLHWELASWLSNLLAFFAAAIALMAFAFLRRKRTLRALRGCLNEHGFPTCLFCGSELRGDEQSGCPACGRPVHDALPRVRRQ